MIRIAVLVIVAVGFFSAALQAQSVVREPEDVDGNGEFTIDNRDRNMENSIMKDTDTLRGWGYSWVGGINGSQAAYSNWSQGGVNTISMNGSTVFNLMFRKKRFAYALLTNFKYGKARLDGDETRKTDDKIAIGHKIRYLFPNENFNAFSSINFNSQFDRGFNYGGDEPEVISRFFAPAYFTQIAGLGYTVDNFMSAEAGLAMKQTVVRDTDLSERYGLDAGENFRFEPGYSILLNFKSKIVNNVTLVSYVETFTNLQENVRSTDVNFSNELVGEINDYIDTTFQFVLIYDDDYSTEVQMKQVLSVGVKVNIL